MEAYGFLTKEQPSDVSNDIVEYAKEQMDLMKNTVKEKIIQLSKCEQELEALRSSYNVEKQTWWEKQTEIINVAKKYRQKYEQSKLAAEMQYGKALATKSEEFEQMALELQVYKDALRKCQEQLQAEGEVVVKTEYPKAEVPTGEMQTLAEASLTAEPYENRGKETESCDESVSTSACSASLEKTKTEFFDRLKREIEENVRLNALIAEHEKRALANAYESKIEELTEELRLQKHKEEVAQLTNNQIENHMVDTQVNECLSTSSSEPTASLVAPPIPKNESLILKDELLKVQGILLAERQANYAANLSLWMKLDEAVAEKEALAKRLERFELRVKILQSELNEARRSPKKSANNQNQCKITKKQDIETEVGPAPTKPQQPGNRLSAGFQQKLKRCQQKCHGLLIEKSRLQKELREARERINYLLQHPRPSQRETALEKQLETQENHSSLLMYQCTVLEETKHVLRKQIVQVEAALEEHKRLIEYLQSMVKDAQKKKRSIKEIVFSAVSHSPRKRLKTDNQCLESLMFLEETKPEGGDN